MSFHEPDKTFGLDAEYLAGKRFPYQEDIALLDDIDLLAATPGPDLNWLEDVALLEEDGVPAVFDRYSNSFLKIYFPIPEGREHEILSEVKRLLAIKAEDDLIANQSAEVVELRTVES